MRLIIFGVLTLFDTVCDMFISFMCIDLFTGSGKEDALSLSFWLQKTLYSKLQYRRRLMGLLYEVLFVSVLGLVSSES